MGQKKNSNIFLLGIKKNEWKSKYLEKSIEESSFYLYQDLEIRKYINQFLKHNGLILHDLKLQYSNSTLSIFISYYIKQKITVLINKINILQKIKLKRVKNKIFFLKKKYTLKNFKKRRKNLKQLLGFKKWHYRPMIELNNFSERFLESLSIFTKKKYNIYITFNNLNKGLSLNLNDFQTKSFKKILLKLRPYSKNVFFKETINILLISITKRKSSKLLSEFIALQLQALKKHNFFLIFLKRALRLLLTSKLSKINGVKLAIKGRFNGAPRARTKTIQIGKVPLQTFDALIDYCQTVAYTPNGTFGIKIWICENY